MSFSTEAGTLISQFFLPRKPAAARVHPVQGRPETNPRSAMDLRLGDSLRTTILQLLWTTLAVGLVTAILFVLNLAIATTLVPIAYVIPVIVAATRWGVWAAAIGSTARLGARRLLFF